MIIILSDGDSPRASEAFKDAGNQKVPNVNLSRMRPNNRFLLYISGPDDTGNREIYETYMHFGRISYTGKQSEIENPTN